jgi:hypothetical protein
MLDHSMGANQMQGDGLIGVGLQYLPADQFRLGQTAGALVAHGEAEGSLEVWR